MNRLIYAIATVMLYIVCVPLCVIWGFSTAACERSVSRNQRKPSPSPREDTRPRARSPPG